MLATPRAPNAAELAMRSSLYDSDGSPLKAFSISASVARASSNRFISRTTATCSTPSSRCDTTCGRL
jgi:hypothetical protein